MTNSISSETAKVDVFFFSINLQDLFPKIFPMAMTGANLNDLNKVVAGKDT